MKDLSKTRQALIQELASLRERFMELKQSESERKHLDDKRSLDSEILANMEEGVHLTRADDGVIIYVNPRFERMFGYDLGELAGKHVSIINAPGEKPPEAIANEIIKSLKQAGAWHGEIHNIRKDGNLFWCYANVSKFKHPQYGEVWLSVHQDITERKRAEDALHRSEENFHHSLDESPLGVRILTIEGETIYANQAILDIYGYNSMEELKTTSVENRYTPESFAEHQIRKEKRKRGDNAPSEYEISIVRKDGEVRNLQVFRKKILWDGERQFQVLYSDITNRKQAEEGIHASLREKEILLREVHHRVKNNMQVISGLLALQARSTGNPELIGMLHESQSRIHAMSLVHEKLYGSKDFARIDLAGYVKTLSQDLFQSYKINPGKIDMIIQTDGDVYVDINKAIPCGLILNELISNALKHAFPGDRHGELQIIIRGIKNTEIEIVVRDNGLGLPDDVDIHQPLSVGLYLVKGLVKSQLDGKMEVRRDTGTEIRIKFPL
jgi:PAS domain S-box-containing protein